MDSKEAIEKMRENPELAKSLEEALRNNADEKELTGMLADAGIDAGTADEMLDEWQRRRGAGIGSEHVDSEALKMVVGGIEIFGGCTEEFYKESCASTVESDSWCWSNDWCILISSEYHCNINAVVVDSSDNFNPIEHDQ